MKQNRIAIALAVALVGTLAVAGCKKKEEAAPAPAPVEAAPAPAPVEAAPAPAPSASFTVGNAAAADKSVAALSSFGAKDKIIVSVKTDATVPVDAAIYARLSFDDQDVGRQTVNVKAEDAGTTNITFSNANPWPVGKYKVEVTLNGNPVGMVQEIEVK